MRIPVPERFSPRVIFVFAMLVLAGQLIEGTDFIFAILTTAFICIWAFAFNAAGGIEYTSGAFIFFNGLLTVIIGLTFKIFLFEPGERNLLAPRTTMACYCVGMAGMAVAAVLASGLRTKRGLLKNFDTLEGMKLGAIICLVLTVVLAAFSGLTSQTGSIGSAIGQINRFPLMSILLATTYEIKHSNGKRSINWIVLCAVALDFLFGVLYFSKEGMLIGPTAWFLAAVLCRYDFPKRTLVLCLVGVSFTVYYLVPYSQYVRNYGGTTRAENYAAALHYLGDLNGTRKLYLDQIQLFDITEEPHLFDQREGFLDRLIILGPDDALINLTEKGKVYGLEPTYQAYANIIPHFIWHGKKVFNTGNVYAHELGELAEDDETTGVSFSPMADAYHQAKWLGLMLLLPLDLFLAFMVTDSLAGSSKYSVWALLPILEVSHLAPEAGLNGVVYLCTYWVIAILFLYWCTKVAGPRFLRVIKRSSPTTVDFPSHGPHTRPTLG